MIDIWIAFVTGLTTGGLSCMAVQGGLLASSLAGQIEQDLCKITTRKAKRSGKGNRAYGTAKGKIAAPILAFLAAKLVAYTLLGLLLGALGSMLQLTPMVRAMLQFAIGIFMVGNALRMLNVHPIFRYFAFEPPSSITRFLRQKARGGDSSLVTPLFLGALTVLIPCGITQTVMAVALASGSPLFGAALLFAFVLGTTPVFFALAYFATQLGASMEKYFVRIVAVIVLVLGLLAIDTGLNLVGSPVSLTRLVGRVLPAGSGLASAAEPILATPDAALSPPPAGTAEITLYVRNSGYDPETLYAPANKPIRLNLVSIKAYTCAVAFVIPELNYQVVLPTDGTVTVDLPAQAVGKVMPFSCSMGMYTGQIVFQ